MQYLKMFLKSLVLFSFVFFTACEDKGYGEQNIEKIPIPTSTKELVILGTTPDYNISQRSYISIEFSNYIDLTSLQSNTISLVNTNTNTPIKITADGLDANLYVKPLQSLDIGEAYTLTIDKNIQDLTGNKLGKSYQFSFVCKDNFWAANTQAGFTHSVALSKDGTIYLWGSNSNRELNGVDTTTRAIPLGLHSPKNPHALSTGEYSTAIITQEGSLYLYGANLLENNTGTDFDKVSLANQHGVVIKTDGTLWSWGANSDGQLGNNGILFRSKLTQEYTKSTSWDSVSTGVDFTIALKKDGSLWGWGKNEYGQIGNTLYNELRTPHQEDTNATDWAMISAGANHSAAIKKDGTLWSWGLNDSGQLGTGDTSSLKGARQEVTASQEWVNIELGYDHTLALKADGTLWSWGGNYYGQLGLGDTSNQDIPQQIGNSNKWVSISAGKYFSLASDSDGKLWAWGYNANAQLGIDTNEDKLEPTEVK
jgi:alpha-tubulin suppressor-like RCC1 family protein